MNSANALTNYSFNQESPNGKLSVHIAKDGTLSYTKGSAKQKQCVTNGTNGIKPGYSIYLVTDLPTADGLNMHIRRERARGWINDCSKL